MNRKRRLLYAATILLVLAVVLVIGCEPAEPTASPTLSPAFTPTTTPTPTLVPTPRLPVLAGTPVPLPQEPITPENAAGVVELALWGKGEIHRIAYSPDGRFLAIGFESGLWLYDAETLELVRFIETSLWVDTFDFTPDGTTIIAGLGASAVASWDVTTGEHLTSLRARESVGYPRGLGSFSVHGAMLAAISEGNPTIQVWGVEKGKLLHTLAQDEPLHTPGGGTRWVSSLAFSPDGSLLASGGTDDLVMLWDVKTGTQLRTLEGHTDSVFALAFSPDGTLLASNSANDGAYLWEVETGTLLQAIEGYFDSVTSQPFSPAGSLLALESGHTIQMWNMEMKQVVQTMDNHPTYVRGTAFSSDGAMLASAGPRGQDMRLWDVKTGTLVHTLEGSGRWLTGPIISPDGTVFVSHREMEQWDIRTGQVMRTLEGPDDLSHVTLSADGTTLAWSETWDLAVWIWDVDTGTSTRFPGPYATFVRDIALSPDGSMFAASSDSGGFSIYDTRSGEHVHAFGGGRSCDLIFSADGTRLLSASFYDDGVYLWEVATGERLRTFELPGHYSRKSAALSPDGTLAAVGGTEGEIWLYNTESGQLVRSLKRATGHVYSLAFFPDGELLASGGQDRMVRLWDVRTGSLLKSLEGHTAAVRYLSFSADGAVLGSGGSDGTVRLWGVPPE